MNNHSCFLTFVPWVLGRGVTRLDGKVLMAGYSSGNLRSQLDPCGWY